MTQKQENLTDRARDSAARAAYAAVGAPSAALKALSAQVSDLKETVKSSRGQLGSDVAREVKAWVREGERVLGRAMQSVRDSKIADEIRSATRSASHAARTGYEKAADIATRPLELVEPDAPLTLINGIGPRFSDQLERAGVSGISSFINRTGTSADIEELAAATGFSASTLTAWRRQVDLARIDGIGDVYLLLLHRNGVWTLDQLANRQTSDLVEALRSDVLPDAPEQLPTETMVKGWRTRARRLAG